ncbi:MAG TPA: anthranilate phosphoribosyltransferase [Tepidisphaeraceae bacterium]|jgi:anthranilate phosphoribosyltransferase
MRDLLLKLCRHENLSRGEARTAFDLIISGQISEAQIGGLLVGLAAKGTNVDELVGAAEALREKCIPIDCGNYDVVLDTCGTGGDVKGTFNISTTAAIIAAAAGVAVAKHGNRSASSLAGSADVLEKLGVKIELSPEQASRCLNEAGICFAFARAHHPALRSVAHVRSSLGIPTIFNIIAPLLNPAKAKHQLIGVFAKELTERMACVLRELGSQRAWVVHAEDGLDELSTMSSTNIAELRDGQVRTWTLKPQELGFVIADLKDLKINSIEEAATAVREVVAGKKGARRDISVLNAAAALVVAEKAGDLHEGKTLAENAIDSGAANRTLDKLIAASNR